MTTSSHTQRARETEEVLTALEFGNRRRCPVCAGFESRGNGETDFHHNKTCPVPRVLSALRLAVPEGCVVVPREPTDAMFDAARDEDVGGCCYSCSRWNCSEDDARRVYAAMLAAAPTITAAEGEK